MRSRSRRWRTGDESGCVASRWDAAPDDTIEVRTVTLGERVGSRWIVDKGLRVFVVDGYAVAKEAGAQLTAELTPHHLVHGLGMGLMLETAVGAWDVVRARAAQSEAAPRVSLA